MKVKVFKQTTNDYPKYANFGDSGMDILCDISKSKVNHTKTLGFGWSVEDNTVIIEPGGNAVIGTGISVSIPFGYEIQVRGKSGLACKGLQITNGLGTIDHLYRGDIGAIIYNASPVPYKFKQGDKVAQLVLTQVERCDWNIVESANDLDDGGTRGEGGYGSTGK